MRLTQAFLEDVPIRKLTSETIKRMFELVDHAKTDAKFQDLVYSMTRGLPNKAYRQEVDRLFRWIKGNIRYTRDPYGVELVQDVWTTLNRQRGDCDDLSILLGAMAEVMGCPVRFCTVSTRKDKEPVHVYPDVFVGGRWISYDPTVASSVPGWKPIQGITDRVCWKRADVGISGYDETNVEGLGSSMTSERSGGGLEDAWNDPLFKKSVLDVNLTPGIPNDISHTYADQTAGSQTIPGRMFPGLPNAPVARYSDEPEAPKTGGGGYGIQLPIKPLLDVNQARYFVPRNEVPRAFNQWGKMLPWSSILTSMLPRPNIPEGSYMSDYGTGLNFSKFDQNELDSIISAIHADVIGHVKRGYVHPSNAPDLSKKMVEAVEQGDTETVNTKTAPTTVSVLKQISARRSMRAGTTKRGPELENPFGEGDESVEWLPALYGLGQSREGIARRRRLHAQVLSLVRKRLPGVLKRYGIRLGMRTPLSGLGADVTTGEAQAVDTLAQGVTNSITDAIGTSDAKNIGSVVDNALDATAKVIAPPKPGIVASTMNLFKGWTIPIIVVAGLALAGGAMARKKKYKRNPSRRRSYRRYYRSRGRGGRRGGGGGGGGFMGMSNKTLLMLGLGGGALYLMSKPSAPSVGARAGVAPQSTFQKLMSSVATLFKPSSPGAASPAAQIVSSGSKLFAPSAAAPAAAAPAAAPSSQAPDMSTLVVSLPEEQPQASSSPDMSTLVTDLPSES